MRYTLIAVLLLAACSDAPTTTGDVALVDCANIAANGSDKRCIRSTALTPGDFGSGFSIGGDGGFPAYARGFVDGHAHLIVAAELGLNTDDYGIIMSVDLETGNRTVVSGMYKTPQGAMMIGNGPPLGDPADVQPLPNGSLVATSRASKAIYQIEPTTGDRKVLWDLSSKIACTGLSEKAYIEHDAIAVGDDGALYAVVSTYSSNLFGLGIVRLTGATCALVTMDAAAVDNHGSGATLELGNFGALRFHDGKIWGLETLQESVITIDPTTGDRVRLSSAMSGYHVGSGDGVGVWSLAFDGDDPWTASDFGDRWRLTYVDPKTGDRSTYGTNLGGPASWNTGRMQAWGFPGGHGYLLLARERGLLVFDPATGNSNNFSY